MKTPEIVQISMNIINKKAQPYRNILLGLIPSSLKIFDIILHLEAPAYSFIQAMGMLSIEMKLIEMVFGI